MTHPMNRTDMNEKTNPAILTVGNYELNTKVFRLICHHADGSDSEQALSFRECRMLEMLILNTDEIVKNEQFSRELWANAYLFSTGSLYVFINRLRRYLAGDRRIRIENLRGVGYRLIFNP